MLMAILFKADGKNIVREVATMDDGLKFTGNNESTENKQKLGSLVKVKGEGTKEGADAMVLVKKFKLLMVLNSNLLLTISQ